MQSGVPLAITANPRGVARCSFGPGGPDLWAWARGGEARVRSSMEGGGDRAGAGGQPLAVRVGQGLQCPQLIHQRRVQEGAQLLVAAVPACLRLNISLGLRFYGSHLSAPNTAIPHPTERQDSANYENVTRGDRHLTAACLWSMGPARPQFMDSCLFACGCSKDCSWRDGLMRA